MGGCRNDYRKALRFSEELGRWCEFFFFFFWLAPMACGILVPKAGIQLRPHMGSTESSPLDSQGSSRACKF